MTAANFWLNGLKKKLAAVIIFFLGDKFTAAFGASTAEHLSAVGPGHALTESVSFFPNNIGRRL